MSESTQEYPSVDKGTKRVAQAAALASRKEKGPSNRGTKAYRRRKRERKKKQDAIEVKSGMTHAKSRANHAGHVHRMVGKLVGHKGEDADIMKEYAPDVMQPSTRVR